MQHRVNAVLTPSCYNIPPELLMLISTFIPLRSAPKTLASLTLVNRQFYITFRHILYSRLILRNEDDAIMVIQRILAEPQLGLGITQLHLMSELSAKTRAGEKPFDVLVGLQMLVTKQLVPRLVSLSIYLLEGWQYDKDYKRIVGHGRLLADFWRSLRTKCPRLRSLMLRNVGHGTNDRWMSGSVTDEIISFTELSCLRLELSGHFIGPVEKDMFRILNNIPRLASSLQTLTIGAELEGTEFFSFDLPNLRWLILQRFASHHDTSRVMGFFERHPQIESLSLLSCRDDWFSGDVGANFLPNLKHLKARFEDIRQLVSILPRLVSLAFVDSYNAQVPYLLRAVIPEGLPNLKSLEIRQTIAGWDLRKVEGVLWYETLDGEFHLQTVKKRIHRDFVNGYLHSIVKGAPNLEELGLQGMWLSSEHLETLGPTLAQFVKMKRFYYFGFSPHPRLGSLIPEESHPQYISSFLSSAEALARICLRLDSVTSISGLELPYPSAIIIRDSAGEVTGVRQSEGVGMQIPAHEDDPFPRHPA